MSGSQIANSEKTQYDAIELIDLHHRYSQGETDFYFVPWSLAKGEQVFLFGDSGSGKSTLLNLLSGILTPTSGQIKLFGTNISELSNRQRDKFRAQNIGVVFQQFNLVPYMSVLQNIKLAAYFGNTNLQDIQPRITVLLEELKLNKSVLHATINHLSVGQRQRVAILRAFVNKPGLLLVDEPTSALDASARDAFMQMLLETCLHQQTSLVFVSHDQALREYFNNHLPMESLLRDSKGNPKKQGAGHAH